MRSTFKTLKPCETAVIAVSQGGEIFSFADTLSISKRKIVSLESLISTSGDQAKIKSPIY